MNRHQIEEEANKLPPVFSLRAFPHDNFRVSLASSFVNDYGTVTLYLEVQREDRWVSFAKGSLSEIQCQMI